MQIVHILTGLPASGKSTFARELITATPGRIRRVNLDDIRAMLDTGSDGKRRYSRELEETTLKIQDAAIRAALDDGFDVIVDNTHLVPRIPKRIKKVVAGDALFSVHDFTHVDVDECIRRDAQRTGPAKVGEEVINGLAIRHAKAKKSGWRLTEEWMNDWAPVEPYVPDMNKPTAVLCDIDGTLALMNGRRSPYDWTRVDQDDLNDPVRRALIAFDAAYADRIILLSGRDESCRDQTLRWLQVKNVPFDALHMRAAGDTRPDDIVKAELFDKYVRYKYCVRVVLDDRDSVVALWRKRLGLPTWQVNYGNF